MKAIHAFSFSTIKTTGSSDAALSFIKCLAFLFFEALNEKYKGLGLNSKRPDPIVFGTSIAVEPCVLEF
ncbi:MAG: hypothetical protein DWI22_12915 [Planctomycetota bacterium]|nr:MAG: hypothetical protein DWI22_12915 [Planctomycetota bacterium]